MKSIDTRGYFFHTQESTPWFFQALEKTGPVFPMVGKIVVILLVMACRAQAQWFFADGIVLSNEYVRQQGLVDLAAWSGGSVTGEAVRGLGVSLGQLGGINPETGEAIADPANLLSLAARTVTVSGASRLGGGLDMSGTPVTNGVYYGDGHGLTNLPAAPVYSISANHVLADRDCQVFSDNMYETWVTLPAAGPDTVGRVYQVHNVGTGLLQVRTTNGTDSLNGVVNGSLAIGQRGSLRIVGVAADEWIASP